MRLRLALKVALCLVALSGAVYLFVYPLRTYLAQRHQVAQVERSISVLGAENAKLNAEYRKLQKTSYVDQLARADYGYVEPGQQAYEVLPPANRPAPAQATSQGATKAQVTGHKGASPSSWYTPLEFWDHL